MREDDLVAAIHADPDSDGPRLVYADWLQSRGDPLGEYIALSLQSERLEDREVREHLAKLDFDRVWEQRFGGRRKTERGMVAWLGIDVAQLEPVLVEHLRGTFVRELRVGAADSDPELDDRRFAVLRDALARMHLRRLSFGADVSPLRLAQVLACVPHVEELSFSGTVIGDDAARVIAAASLPKLARLAIFGWQRRDSRHQIDAHRMLGDRGAIAIAERGGLVELALTNVAIGPDGAAALVSGRLPLAILDLSGNPIGSSGVVAIARGVAPVESLAIAGVGLDDEAVAALAHTPALSRLRRLALAGSDLDSGLTQAQLAMLVASPYLSRELVLALDGIALQMDSYSSDDTVYTTGVDPCWVGPLPPAIEARFRVEVAGYPRDV